MSHPTDQVERDQEDTHERMGHEDRERLGQREGNAARPERTRADDDEGGGMGVQQQAPERADMTEQRELWERGSEAGGETGDLDMRRRETLPGETSGGTEAPLGSAGVMEDRELTGQAGQTAGGGTDQIVSETEGRGKAVELGDSARPLEKRPVTELRKLAGELKIPGRSRLSKAQLIEAIRQRQTSQPPG